MSQEALVGGDNFVTPSEALNNQTQNLPPNLNARLGDVEGLTKTILTVVVISVAAMVVSVIIGAVAIVMDQLHFNNELYRDDRYVHTKTVEHTVHESTSSVIFPNVNPK